MIREVTIRQFNAFCYVRDPFLGIISSEVAWFEAFDKKLLGTIIKDFTDQDYGFVVLGRDARKVFRAIDLPDRFYATKEEAIEKLKVKLESYKDDNNELYPQGDEKHITNEILIPKVSNEKLHPYFKLLIEKKSYEAARNIIKEIAYSYVDVDGNYIKDFQTTGFDARLWELYLYIFLHSSGFTIDNNFQAPDYVLTYFGCPCSIEAVTVNPSKDFDEPPPKNPRESYLLSRDYMPIKFGSSLFSKLQKKYWEKEHVKGKPFIIAIHDFHMAASMDNLGSMTWSRNALIDYLYGIRMKSSIDKDGKIVMEVKQTESGVEPITEEIISHTWKNKTIPSNFFGLPDAENVSAVLFTNNATLTTFNRMGKLAGLGGSKIRMLRQSIVYDPDPFATEPIIKVSDVDSPDYEESWSDGLVMYHNPDAKFPLDRELFSNISHIYFDKADKKVFGYTQPYDVLSSFTMVLTTTD
ncbi:MAG: hypothetical protein Q8M29_18505 [Bacteroidota bacterium]|nr:hypothetical protein [Bacteroidota bacterium]